MRRWLLRVAVPPAAFLLGWSAARLCTPAPRQSPPISSARIKLQPFLEPPLRHGGCQGLFWLAGRTNLQSRSPIEAQKWTPNP